MTAAESRGFLRAAGVLLALSAIRVGWTAWVVPAPLAPPGEAAPPELLAASDSAVLDARVREAPLGTGERIDPNQADEAHLDRLPGVGAATARAIIATRQARGSFATPEDLLSVPGIGARTLGRIRPHLDLRVPGRRSRRPRPPDPPRVNVNGADSAALTALPGIGPALAERIVRARDAGGRFRDLDDLQRVPGIGPATAARLAPRVRFGPGG